MIEGHVKETVKRCQSANGQYIVVSQDTTYYNYTGHKRKAGLGLIQSGVKGIMQHNVLAMDEQGEPLGLLYQRHWSRQSEKDFQGKESQKWHEGLKAVNASLAGLAHKVVVVQDREADIFSFFKAKRAEGIELLVRVHQPRKVEIIEQGQIVKLPQIAEALPVRGYHQVRVERNGKSMWLSLALRFSAVNILTDKDLSAALHKATGLWLIVASEVAATDEQGQDVFEEQTACCWYLLSSVAAETVEQARQLCHFYALRWGIERLHYTMKTGALQVERLQFDDVKTAINALAFYSIVAWELLRLTYWVRKNAAAPANSCFQEQEISLLQAITNKKVATVGEAILALGNMVGFVRTKKQPLPGVKILAEAIVKFQYVKMGANAIAPT